MTLLLWAVPLGVAVVLLIPIGIAAVRLVDEAARLRSELRAFAEMRPALVEVRSEAERIRRAALEVRRR